MAKSANAWAWNFPHWIIADARELNPNPTLDRDGFTLVVHNSTVTDCYDDTPIEGIYAFEAAQLVQQSSGATAAIVFDNTRRPDAPTIRQFYQNRRLNLAVPSGRLYCVAEPWRRDVIQKYSYS